MKMPQDTLRSLQDMMDTAEMGFKMFADGTQPERLLGLKNLIVFGRAVTHVLQNLRSTESNFDEWYGKYKMEMQDDPLMKYFNDLRSEILKEGTLRVGWKARIKMTNVYISEQLFGPPPPNAKHFFSFDIIGGTGWEIQLPDGSIEKFYVKMPDDIASMNFNFPNPPTKHLGKAIMDTSVQTLARLYLDYLQQIVKSAKAKFAKKEFIP